MVVSLLHAIRPDSELRRIRGSNDRSLTQDIDHAGLSEQHRRDAHIVEFSVQHLDSITPVSQSPAGQRAHTERIPRVRSAARFQSALSGASLMRTRLLVAQEHLGVLEHHDSRGTVAVHSVAVVAAGVVAHHTV